MWLENVVIDAADPRRLGAFWRDALGAQTLTWEDDLVELRLAVADDAHLDVCLPRTPDVDRSAPRLHLDLDGGVDRDAVAERLLALGATRLDIGQRDVPWVVLADPESNRLCVRGSGAAAETGPLAAVLVESADPHRDARFWADLVGWEPVSGATPSLRHPSGRGPVLEFRPERAPKSGKNALHLDARCDAGEALTGAVDRAVCLGARRLDHAWGELPWVVLADPSGNEFCILPPPR